MNMFKPVKAASVEEYFRGLPAERREPMEFLHTLIRKTVPSLKPNFLYNMPGYGTFKYINYKKDVIDWPVISIASQKQYISIYVCAMQNGAYLVETYASKLGHVKVGKSCIRFKKIDDLNHDALKTVFRIAERSPGLIRT